jgi:arylsulfatase A-like enzyme
LFREKLLRNTIAWLSLLGPRDWIYSLSLLIPFVVYNLAMKVLDVVLQLGEHGLALSLELMRSDVLFNLAYGLLWIGLFALPGVVLRRVVVVLFHATTAFVATVSIFAHQYLRETGSTLDYDVIALWISKPQEIAPLLTEGVPFSAWVILAAVLFYAILGSWLVTRAVERWRGPLATSQVETSGARSLVRTPRTSYLHFLGLGLLAVGFGSLSAFVGASPAVASKSLARDPFVNVVLTGVEGSASEEDDSKSSLAIENPAAYASLAQTPRTQKRNVVLIHLESTRAGATTPYNEDLDTTPFLNELAKESLLAERAYTTVPHTSKATTSVNCGIFPHLDPETTEALPGGIPAPCLAGLLKDQGYKTVFFQSSTEDFENFEGLVSNFGYEEYYPLESIDTKGFEKTNYFGPEDDIMLKPSAEWLKEHEEEPFMAEYLLGTGHHDYQCLGTRYEHKDFSEDDLVNHYLNCMRLQDIFLKNLIDQYKELGLYENTIFVIYGDHGEGFGEHGRFQHNDTTWEEGLKVPLIIHAPGWFENGERIKKLSNHTDILPTVLDMLGYEVTNGKYPGYSLLRPLPEDRTLNFSCWNENVCLASIEGTEKYIHHYDNQPEEIFDLSKDSLEEHNLAGEYSKAQLDKRREELIEWRWGVDAEYGNRGR